MVINITILIQMFHFFLAYMILSRFLFKPVFYIVQNEDNNKQKMLSLINFEQKEIDKKLLYKDMLWKESLQKFSTIISGMEKDYYKKSMIWQSIEPVYLNAKSQELLKDNISKFLLKKVQDV